jgi:phosphoribosylformylglycinamidine (FGAM) synthase PurS component
MVATALAKLARPSPPPGCSTIHAPFGDPWDVSGLAEAEAAHKAEGERLLSLRRAQEQQMQEQKDAAKAEASVAQMCEKLLANMVIESYRVEIL